MANETQLLAENRTYRTTHRFIRERWVITGQLELLSPTHFGSGEVDQFTNMPLMRDEADGITPFIPGTSIAGALRNYLRERECGYGRPMPGFPKNQPELGSGTKAQEERERQQKAERELMVTRLFGAFRGDDEGIQSPLVVYDAYGKASDFELRDGVTIDPNTRTAEDKKKFDIELLSAGSTFNLRFELAISVPPKPKGASDDWDKEMAFRDHRIDLLIALVTALDGLAKGEITIGARKRRGYGECHVNKWTIQRYDLTEKSGIGLLTWLLSERDPKAWSFDKIKSAPPVAKESIVEAINAFKISPKPISIIEKDRRQQVTLEAEFILDGSLLIRSGFGESLHGPDTRHLHSRRDDKRVPVVSGTSWAGVLRHRAGMIARTFAISDTKAEEFIQNIFGSSPEEEKKSSDNEKSYLRASRLIVKETAVQQPQREPLVQTRVKIDRFTGGAFETALFSEEPLWGVEDREENGQLQEKGTRIKLNVTLRPPSPEDPLDPNPPAVKDAEIGMLLLLLKDLWTGDLPIGGEASIGRGRLRGKSVTLKVPTSSGEKNWRLEAKGEYGVLIKEGKGEDLEKYVDAFNKEMAKQ